MMIRSIYTFFLSIREGRVNISALLDALLTISLKLLAARGTLSDAILASVRKRVNL